MVHQRRRKCCFTARNFFSIPYSWRGAAFSVIVIMGLDFLLLPSLLCTTQPSDDVKQELLQCQAALASNSLTGILCSFSTIRSLHNMTAMLCVSSAEIATFKQQRMSFALQHHSFGKSCKILRSKIVLHFFFKVTSQPSKP